MRKAILALATVATLGMTAVTAPAPAEARGFGHGGGGWHGGGGGWHGGGLASVPALRADCSPAQ